MTTTCLIEPIADQKELVRTFADAMAHYQLFEVEELLDEGKYCYFCEEGERVETDKAGFAEYLREAFLPRIQVAAASATIEINQCIACRMGNPVVLLDDGTFPHHSMKEWPTKVGFMLETEDGRIKAIRPCTSFENTENNPERQRELEFMRNNPLTKEDFESFIEEGWTPVGDEDSEDEG
jgi:hypothetical protein